MVKDKNGLWAIWVEASGTFAWILGISEELKWDWFDFDLFSSVSISSF
jgi:hypothetical protein